MNMMKKIDDFYASPLGGEVRKALLRAIRSGGLRTGYDVRTLIIGWPNAYAVAISETVLGPLTIAYNESDTPPAPPPYLPRADIAAISHNTLPFADFMFDQVIILHALEFSPSPVRLMREVQRSLASDGRVIALAANRQGMWSWFSSTPFGEGMTFSGAQLRRVMEDAELSPLRVSSALFFPPVHVAAQVSEAIENVGQYLGVGNGGVVVGVATKQRYAGTPKKSTSSARAKGGLQWASARATHGR